MRNGQIEWKMQCVNDPNPQYVLVVMAAGGSISAFPFLCLTDVETWLRENEQSGWNIERAQLFQVQKEIQLESTELRQPQPVQIIRGKAVPKKLME